MDNFNVDNLFIDTLKQNRKEIKEKNVVIILLVIIIFVESLFIAYNMQYDTIVETEETTEEITEENEDVDISSEGEGAEANYVGGNQYNDSSTHNENGGDK